MWPCEDGMNTATLNLIRRSAAFVCTREEYLRAIAAERPVQAEMFPGLNCRHNIAPERVRRLALDEAIEIARNEGRHESRLLDEPDDDLCEICLSPMDCCDCYCWACERYSEECSCF